jgi:hypothetical protein
MNVPGRIEKGHVVLDHELDLPDGTPVEVVVSNRIAVDRVSGGKRVKIEDIVGILPKTLHFLDLPNTMKRWSENTSESLRRFECPFGRTGDNSFTLH